MGRTIDLPGLGAVRLGAAALLFSVGAQPAQAQQALASPPPPAETPAAAPVAPVLDVVAPPQLPAAPTLPGASQCPPSAADAAPCVPALTPVVLALRAHLGSGISKSGESFRFELAQPVMLAGKQLIPAGTPGVGEVVHAKKNGGSGASGELVLAARYLEIGDRRLRLRSLNFARAGQDRIGTAITASMVVSIAGYFVKGESIDLPPGTEVVAKTAEPFVLDLPAPAQPSPAPAAVPAS